MYLKRKLNFIENFDIFKRMIDISNNIMRCIQLIKEERDGRWKVVTSLKYLFSILTCNNHNQGTHFLGERCKKKKGGRGRKRLT